MGGEWRHIGEIAERDVHNTGLRVVARLLVASSDGDDTEALNSFRQADEIRRHLGRSWSDLIVGDGAP